ncbi:MAG: hypothetical protein ACLFR7_08010 [Opitutales bacterium]
MRYFALLLILAGLALNLTGCNESADRSEGEAPERAAPGEPPPSKTMPAEEQTFEIEGVVVRKELEGGFYAIHGADGQAYDPVELPEAFREDGLPVRVVARRKEDALSIHMYGEIIEVVEIEQRATAE